MNSKKRLECPTATIQSVSQGTPSSPIVLSDDEDEDLMAEFFVIPPRTAKQTPEPIPQSTESFDCNNEQQQEQQEVHQPAQYTYYDHNQQQEAVAQKEDPNYYNYNEEQQVFPGEIEVICLDDEQDQGNVAQAEDQVYYDYNQEQQVIPQEVEVICLDDDEEQQQVVPQQLDCEIVYDGYEQHQEEVGFHQASSVNQQFDTNVSNDFYQEVIVLEDDQFGVSTNMLYPSALKSSGNVFTYAGGPIRNSSTRKPQRFHPFADQQKRH